ncbi:carboxyltransferase domain-containing protein [Microbacterium hominis]|uniref:5-oxoprolinase subunit B/C family protein n=1 Tax=Microbacterium hominis TaxID=162426 RepID=UPI0009E8D425|nr:carboxyltransferase domain-containing protein [Microbacterium hominis]
MLALHARLSSGRIDGVVDLVPAARTVLVVVDPAVLPLTAARAWIAAAVADGTPAPARTPRTVEIPVVYDGDDLAEAASLLAIRPAELVRRHAAARWTVAFTGFAPGFGYLVSPDWRFDVPRRARPRPRVPAGAVGLAGAFSGAYPRATPGGWQLIGTTSAPLFDPDAATPALLQPGDLVRFVPLSAASATPAVSARPRLRTETSHAERGLGAPMVSHGRAAAHAGGRSDAAAIRVLAPGLLATVQDQGRPGALAAGVAVSGAADRAALRTANRLVGTDENAAGIEITMGGFRAVREAAASDDVWFAVAGAWGPVLLDGRPVDPYAAHRWPPGAELRIDWFDHGARGYLALHDRVEAARPMGSRATGTLAGLGPPPLSTAAAIVVGDAVAVPLPADDLHFPPPPGADLEVALAPGPRAHLVRTLAPLYDAVWTVSAQADRVGIRLDGPGLERTDTAEIPSEGMLPGAIQVPPDGRPVILGPDGPVTGGYPVVAVVTDADRDALGQARPGTRIRFRHARTVL